MAAAVPKKRVHKEVTLELKYKALLELDKGKTNKEVALLFGIPPNHQTLCPLGKKTKAKIIQAFQAGSVSNKRVKADTYEQVNSCSAMVQRNAIREYPSQRCSYQGKGIILCKGA